jgi:hypothetical protein
MAWNYIALFTAVAAIVWLGMNALHESARRQRESFARSVPGVARVLKVGNSTASRSYRAMVIDLLIQVHRPGVLAYELSTIWSVEYSALPRVQVGQTFAIKVDPLDPKKIYSGETWAHSLGVKKQPIE